MAYSVTKIGEKSSWIVFCKKEHLKSNSSKIILFRISKCWIYIYHHPFNSNALSTTLCTLHIAYVDTILLRLLLKHYSALCVSQKVRLSTTMRCTLFWIWHNCSKKTTSTTKATMLYALFFNTLLNVSNVAVNEKCEDVSKKVS